MFLRRGLFICIEGIDGCGKTTQAKLLTEDLIGLGYKVVYTSEPTKEFIGQVIRDLVLVKGLKVSPETEASLFALDRFFHTAKIIIPALQSGAIVLAERYIYSSLAYQGARGLNLDYILNLNKEALKPDIAIYIDIKPELAIRRIKERRECDSFEELEYQSQVRQLYLKLVKQGYLMMVDGGREASEVYKDVKSLIAPKLKTFRNLASRPREMV